MNDNGFIISVRRFSSLDSENWSFTTSMGWIRLIAKRIRKDNLSILKELEFLTKLMLGRSAASLPYLSDTKTTRFGQLYFATPDKL